MLILVCAAISFSHDLLSLLLVISSNSAFPSSIQIFTKQLVIGLLFLKSFLCSFLSLFNLSLFAEKALVTRVWRFTRFNKIFGKSDVHYPVISYYEIFHKPNGPQSIANPWIARMFLLRENPLLYIQFFYGTVVYSGLSITQTSPYDRVIRKISLTPFSQLFITRISFKPIRFLVPR